MHAILEIPSVRERVSRLTVEEYHQLPEFNSRGRRTELIRGIVVEKMSKPPLHGTIALLLQEMLRPTIPPGFCLRLEQPLTLADSEPEPDLAIVAGALRDYLQLHPSTAHLVVEVAVSSWAEDQWKAVLYAEAAIAEYWIVLPASRTIEVYRRPENGRYMERRLYSQAEVLSCASVPGTQLSLATLFADLPV